VDAVEAACRNTPVKAHLLGDEYHLVYSVTGRWLSPAGLPLHVGGILANVARTMGMIGPRRAAP